MKTCQFIEILKLTENLHKIIYVIFFRNAEEKYFADIFGNNLGSPVIHTLLDKPIPNPKKAETLLNEVFTWERDHGSSKCLLLCKVFEYADESYDLKYYSVGGISASGEEILIYSDEKEVLELRKHFKPYNES